MSSISSGSSSETKLEEFSGLRKFFWPVYKSEYAKVFFMSLMMFSVLFNYTILRDIKDVFILTTAKGCGAESFNFLKLWGTLPCAVILLSAYAKLSLHLSKKQLFFTTLSFFGIFFVLFNFILLPNVDYIHPSYEWIVNLSEYFKVHPWCSLLRFVVPLIGNWSFALFYIFAELWGTLGMAILFWQFANETTKSSNAKRLYPIYGLISNLGAMLAGGSLIAINKVAGDNNSLSINIIIILLVVFFGVLAFAYSKCTKIIELERQKEPESNEPKKAKKIKTGFLESMKVVFSSKYLGFLAVLILSYGITINFLDVSFKNQVKLLFPKQSDMIGFMGFYSICTSVLTIVLMIIGSNITRTYSWLVCAMVTPVILLFAGCAFFSFLCFKGFFISLLGISSSLMLKITVGLGVFLIVFGRGAKYAFFDPTRERAYIPLEDNLRVRGKAAVDGIGGRLGKSGGSIIQQILLYSPAATQMSIAPYLGIILVVLVLGWIVAVKKLSNMFESINKH